MTSGGSIDWSCFAVHVDISGPVFEDYRDPCLLDWSGRATYTLTGHGVSDPQTGEALTVTKIGGDEDPCSEWTVLTLHGLIIDTALAQGSIPRLLDDQSEDYDHFGVLFDGNDFHPELLEMIDGVFGRVVLIDRVRLAPAWRGRGGVGRLLTSRVLRLFAEDAAVVAANPFPIDLFAERDNETGLTTHPRFGEELAKVQRTWGSLGFQLYKDPIWVMDPAMSAHSRAVAELERQLAD